uniref:Uncharacterized protein n=1 Tax=Candidatus Kentrum sp. LFY TaxID=2126342 RepID=A0A450UJB0_9GAMM|nr:MAG: hypothetical protein BECKLFY1418B_GA0070995_103727 [Candidatus Kentron sp. LFY]
MLALRARSEAGWARISAPVFPEFLFFRYVKQSTFLAVGVAFDAMTHGASLETYWRFAPRLKRGASWHTYRFSRNLHFSDTSRYHRPSPFDHQRHRNVLAPGNTALHPRAMKIIKIMKAMTMIMGLMRPSQSSLVPFGLSLTALLVPGRNNSRMRMAAVPRRICSQVSMIYFREIRRSVLAPGTDADRRNPNGKEIDLRQRCRYRLDGFSWFYLRIGDVVRYLCLLPAHLGKRVEFDEIPVSLYRRRVMPCRLEMKLRRWIDTRGIDGW